MATHVRPSCYMHLAGERPKADESAVIVLRRGVVEH